MPELFWFFYHILDGNGGFKVAKKLKIEKEKRKEKWNMSGLSDGIIDTDMLTSSHIEIFGKNQIVIEGCLGVFEYRDDYLHLKLQKGAIILCGKSFNISVFEEKRITVKGKISSIEFN